MSVEAHSEQIVRPIRRLMPNFGGIDLSPVVLILLLQALRILLGEIQLALFQAGIGF